jgi:tetratricopeptide (TPR) repeat protein
MQTIMSKLLVPAISLLLLSIPVGVAYAQATRQSVEDRMPYIEKLLNQSSAARQVINSSSSEAKRKRQQALELYRQANEKHSQGDNQAAAELLKQSSRLMFEQIIANYGQRRESVVALRDAFNRISDENNETDDKRKVNDQLEQLTRNADKLLQQGQNAEARIEIDKAYHLLQVSIESIRSGQTLVRSLQFESKQDEYLYEIDRNDTHSMLISLLVDEKLKSDSMQEKIVDFVASAKQFRQQAEAYAGDGAFDQAIELLEMSTAELVRAIRSAGIYIPG